MLIQPNTEVRVLHNAKPDPDYNNTLTFTNASAQSTYFKNLTKYTFSAQTYQRVNKKVIRLNRKADDLYDVNYMMFQNTSYGNKWFYAFVTKVDYINDVTSEIHYFIDVMQTWLFDWFPNQCFVIREHSATDEIGDNIVPEPIEVGEMVMNQYNFIDERLNEFVIILMVCDVESADGDMIEGVFSGAELYAFRADNYGIDALNDMLDTYSVKPDAIIGMYMCPCLSVSYPPSDPGYAKISNREEARTYECVLPQLTAPLSMDGYQPKNRKLYTYPFNFLHVDNGSGNSLSLRYEFFDDLTPKFDMICTVTQPVEVSLRPKNYKGSNKHGGVSHQSDCYNAENISLKGYPICSWNMDSWKAWVAQNSIPLAMQTGVSLAGVVTNASNQIGQGVAGLLSGNTEKAADVSNVMASSAVDVAGIASNVLTQMYRASIASDIYKGALNNGGINCASRKQNFYLGRMSVNGQMARIIDNYFDRFGYATNRVKTPGYKTRPYWNYVKTLDSNVSGSIPADDKMVIDGIFNKGITFWHDPAHFEEYSLNNSPT